MGGIQSSRRNSYTQTPFEYKTYIDEPMGRCSTFNDISASAAPPAKMEVPWYKQPQQKSQKYDPTYAIWKSVFEDKSMRCPRTLLPIKDENAASQNITDAVAGQRTPNGFPSFTEMRGSKKAVIHQDNRDNYEVRTSHETTIDSVAPALSTDRDATRYQAALHNINVKRFTDDDKKNQDYNGFFYVFGFKP